MSNPDSLQFQFSGVTLVRGTPSKVGKDRYFYDQKEVVVIDGQTYTAFHKIALYHEGGEVKVPKAKDVEVFDSSTRPRTTKAPKAPAVQTVAVTSDGGGAQGAEAMTNALAKVMALLQSQQATLDKLTAGNK